MVQEGRTEDQVEGQLLSEEVCFDCPYEVVCKGAHLTRGFTKAVQLQSLAPETELDPPGEASNLQGALHTGICSIFQFLFMPADCFCGK